MSLFKNKTMIKRNMTKSFSEKVDLKLIALVQAHPVLYDFNDPKYMDFNTREVAWQKIGDELEKPAADCKIRWINIRDVHRRILRRSQGNRARAPRAYKYDKLLDFMRDYYKEVITTAFNEDNEPEDDDNTETWDDHILPDNNDSETEEEKPLAKQKRIRKPKKQKNLKINKFEEVDVTASTTNDASYENDYDVSDPVDSFLISIGATLKKFSPYHLNLAKSKIFHIVQEHDLQQIVEKQQGRLDSVSTSSADPTYYHG